MDVISRYSFGQCSELTGQRKQTFSVSRYDCCASIYADMDLRSVNPINIHS